MQELEMSGWTFTRGTYFKGRCPCGSHQKMIHVTPSDPKYLRNLKAHVRRLECPGRREP